LGAPTVLARVIDIFRVWDEDGSGTVSKREFARALPMLGLPVTRDKADELFDLIDEDGSGQLEYADCH
jgi:Ca2+-binding EF-hand superfamily protein